MKNMKWALTALAIGLSVAGCSVFQGEDGTIQGKIVDYNTEYYWDNFTLWYYEDYEPGFPDKFFNTGSTITKYFDDVSWDTYFDIEPGSYGFAVIPEDYYYYYTSRAYLVTYTVKADKGGFLVDGKDKKFAITLGRYYATGTGLNITGPGGVSETQPDGSVIFRNGAITVEARIKMLDKLPEGMAPLNKK